MTGIDISVGKEELRDTLAGVRGCRALDIRVAEIRIYRGGFGSAWTRCPTVAPRKLIRAGRVALGPVNGKGRSYPEEAPTMLQMIRAEIRESDLQLDNIPGGIYATGAEAPVTGL